MKERAASWTVPFFKAYKKTYQTPIQTLQYLPSSTSTSPYSTKGNHSILKQIQLLLWFEIVMIRLPSIEVQVNSNIPVGSGLGSSAAFAVCVATALLTLKGNISTKDGTAISFKGQDCIKPSMDKVWLQIISFYWLKSNTLLIVLLLWWNKSCMAPLLELITLLAPLVLPLPIAELIL